MNDHNRARPPQPGPACEYFAPLLPLVGQERLNPRDSSSLRQHLATCDYCQSELDSYTWLDDTLARHFGPAPRGPLSPGDIRELTSRAYRPRTNVPEPMPAPESLSNHHQQRPSAAFRLAPPQPARRGRRVISILSAVAAVLVIAAVSLALFESRTPTNGKPNGSTPTTTAPVYVPDRNDLFNSIAMVSPTEGWIVGGNMSINGGPVIYGPLLLLHYLNGQVFRVDNLALPEAGAEKAILQRVVMLSASEGWAIGTYIGSSGCTNTLILHYTNGQWKQDTTIAGIILTSISMASTTDGWAAGVLRSCNASGSDVLALFHYNGTR